MTEERERQNIRSKGLPPETQPGERLVIDELDRKLLMAYQLDSRRSLREIAGELGVSPATVLARTRKLERAGIIKGYTVMLDYERLGYELTAITEIVVSRGRLLEMEREIAKMPEVCAVYDVTGETDGIVIAKFRSREELSRFTKSLLAMPFVERTNTHVVLTTVKEDFRLPP
jgi:DNA-binding Lrp family transcriptional regulator